MSILLSTKTKLLEERMKIYLQDLQQQVLRGEIKSPVEMSYRLYQAMQDVYLNQDKPSFKVRPAKWAPISDDYHAMMQEAVNDITMMYKELGELAKAIVVEFKNIEIQRSNIDGKIKALSNRISTISTKAKESLNVVEIFKETFANTDYYDVDIVKDSVAEINRRAGVLTLSTEDTAELDDLNIRIANTSGLPGNTHQVRVNGNRYRFYGEDGLHINPAEILDGNTDTWFEIEQFAITEVVNKLIGGLGLDYIEGISWIKNGDLYMDLYLEAPVAKPVNWISIVPFIPPDKGATAPIIESLILDDGKGLKSIITKDQQLSNDTVFMISKQNVKTAIFRLRQPNPYTVTAGHWAFMEQGEKKGNQFNEIEQEKTRAFGPMPSVENLGVKYNPRTRNVDWPVYTKDTTFNETQIKNDLFNVTDNDLEVYLEGIQATRYQIGLREVLLANYRFKDRSTYISKIWKARKPISEIVIDASQQIPQEFVNGDWVAFYISVDDAGTWHRIYPMGTIGTNLKKRYLVNSNTPLEGRLDSMGYIETSDPVQEVRVKIELSRPALNTLDDADFFTPLVIEYDLKVTTRSE